MENGVRDHLPAQTRQALDAEDWDAVERIWQPWVEQGDAEAGYQMAYHYLCTPCEDDAVAARMEALLRHAAAENHPDAIWFLAKEFCPSREDPEFERQLLRAGRLGSVKAQRSLGVAYATGDWSGPMDLAEAARWYRLAAEKGHAESQYDLGFMMLLGEGGPKNVQEGLMWLERAGAQGLSFALRLLADCYGNGFCDVPVDARKAALWRGRWEEWQRLNPPQPSVRCVAESAEANLDAVMDIGGGHRLRQLFA